MNLSLLKLQGAALTPHLKALAELRIQVFFEWPYLYDGDLAYEEQYLARYQNCPQSLVCLVYDNDHLVGASTCLPAVAAEEDFQIPLKELKLPKEECLYLGESLLLSDYRGHGLGHQFFDAREQHAYQLGLRHCFFCAVERPEEHPLRPSNARGHASFWQSRGYDERNAHIELSWKDRGQREESRKRLQVWHRALP